MRQINSIAFFAERLVEVKNLEAYSREKTIVLRHISKGTSSYVYRSVGMKRVRRLMWPKRKKGKARATKMKLKALQPPGEQQGIETDSDAGGASEAVEPQVQDARSAQDDLVSGVWKSKVLTNYKQNPKNSHNLLARIPTGKAAFEAGERQKAELVKEAMIKVVDRMFDNFQNTAYEFNQVTAGTNLELNWIRPHFTQEEASNWHESTKVLIDIFTGRISTRYWTLAVRGTTSGVDTYILPSDKLLGFSTSPTSYPTYLSMASTCDGLAVDWIVANKTIDPEILPSIYRALLDGLIRFASEEALPGETFRLEDIGIVPEAAAPMEEPVGYQGQSTHDLLGQSSAEHPSLASPSISTVSSGSADRFIDNISNQVAQAAQSETDKFRESMQAPPFGTNTRTPGDMGQSGVMSARSNSLQPQDVQQTPGFQPPPAFQQPNNGNDEANDGDDAQWKSVSSDHSAKTDWQKFMESTKEHVKNSAPPSTNDDNWNTLPGTEKLARPEPRVSSVSQQMSNSQVMPGLPYPSYGNADDPPELLKPVNHQSQAIGQSGGYPVHPAASQSGVNSAQYAQQANYGMPGSSSGGYSGQPGMSQSGVFSGQHQQQMPPQMMPPGYNQQMGMPQQMPGMIQPMANHPGLPSLPGMINPGLSQSGAHQQPMMPDHLQYPQAPQGLVAPSLPTGMIQMNAPEGMSPAAPSAMPPHLMPGQPVDSQLGQQYNAVSQQPPQYNAGPQYNAAAQQGQSPQYSTGGQPSQASMYNTGAQPAQAPQYSTGGQPQQAPQYNTGGQPAQQYNTGSQPAQPQQYNTGSQPALPQQYNTGSQPAQPQQYNSDSQPAQSQQYHTGSQPAQQQHYSSSAQAQQYNTGGHQGLPPQYNSGAQQSPAQYSTDAHQQLQYAQGGYEAYAQPVQEQPEEEQPYPEAEVGEQEHRYSEEQFPTEEESGWQPEEIVEVSVDVEEATWEEPSSQFAQSSFPQESFNELPVMSSETVQKFQDANKAGFVFSSENDLVDAISVVLDTIDSQIELLAQQGTDAFRDRDFRRAESIIKLSERLTSFKAESQAILNLMTENQQ